MIFNQPKKIKKVDTLNYKKNLLSFIDNISNSFVKKISLDVDTNPTFDKKAIPFQFIYCNFIRITTDKENFDLNTSMTDQSFETFWIFASTEVKDFSRNLEINSKVKGISFKNADDYAFKIRIEFENKNLSIYSAEILDEGYNTFDYRINDEMLLVFENDKEAEKFETIINEKKSEGS